jgi:hypothetical protein
MGETMIASSVKHISFYLILTRTLCSLCVSLAAFGAIASNDNLAIAQVPQNQSLSKSLQTYITGTNYFKWGESIYEGPLLDRIYSQRQYRSIWLTSDYAWTSFASEAVQLFINAQANGLNPEVYWTKELSNAYKKVFAEKDMSYAILLELGITDSLYRYARDASVGRLNPKLVDGDQAYPSKQWSQND